MRINKYNKPKDYSGGGSNRANTSISFVGSTSTNTGVSDEARKLLETHLIFGLPFNGTLDVDGELTTSGNISAEGNITSLGTISGDTVIADNALIEDLSGSTIKYNDAEFKLAIIDALTSVDITTENLTVTKLAHFFELIIDKIKAAGGAILLTPADGFKVEKVKLINSLPAFYRLYWKATDGDKAISNMWKVGDLAICLTFNNATVGTSYDVSNKYYWSLVTNVGTEVIDDLDYHFITITGSNTANNISDYDGTINPEVGDEIAMLGYRGTDDPNRLSAIYLAAYDSIDPTLKAPLICQYKGINDFDLKNHKYTWFAANGSEIRGNLKVESGETVEEEIAQLQIKANEISSTVEQHTIKIDEIDGLVKENTTNISKISLKADKIESSVKRVEDLVLFDLANPDNWSSGTCNTSAGGGTTFDNVMNVNSNIVIRYNHPIPYTPTTYISLNDGYLALITYYDANKYYLRNSLGWVSGLNIKLKKVANAGYFGLVIATSMMNQISYSDAPKAGVIITDTKIAQSLIRLTADEILLKVDEVALKIDNKKIVLDGDTEINGNLTMDNGDLGFILKGDSGITQITPLSIGSYSNFSSKATTTIPIAWSDSKTLIANSTITLVSTYSLGSIPANTYITLKDGKIRTNGVEFYGGVTIKDVLYKLKEDNTTVKLFNAGGTVTSDTILNYTTTLAGNYSVEILYSILNTTINNTTANITSSLNVVLPTGCFNLIGYDGVAMNFGNLKTVYFGNEGAYISYGNKRLKIDSTGIYKYGGVVSLQPSTMTEGDGTDSAYSRYLTEYAPINGCVVRLLITFGTSYLQPNDEFVVFAGVSGELILLLPTPSQHKGRLIYVKSISNGGTYTLKGKMMPANQNGEITTLNVGTVSLMLICDGTHWILF